MRHKFLVLTVKKLLKSVSIYGSYRKNKTGVPFFWNTLCVAKIAETRQNPEFGVFIDLSLDRLPDPSWRRYQGRPRNRWLDQLRRTNGPPPAELWRRAVMRGHLGLHSGVTLRSSVTTDANDNDDDRLIIGRTAKSTMNALEH